MTRDGKGNTEEANQIKTNMDSLWFSLSAEEQESMDNLAVELYYRWGGPDA